MLCTRGHTHLEHGIDALPLGVAHGTEPVAGHGAGHEARHVGDDEAEGPAADAAEQRPELARRRVGPVPLGHALLAHHLLEHVLELRILRLLAVARRPVALLLVLAAGEEVPRPRVGVARARSVVAALRRDLLVGGLVVLGEGVRVRGPRGGGRGGGLLLPAARAGEQAALGVVLAPAGGVREGEVGVVYELELARAGGAVGRVGGDAVGVRLEGRAGDMIAALSVMILTWLYVCVKAGVAG